jgi:epsilon-lactone hydrolase
MRLTKFYTAVVACLASGVANAQQAGAPRLTVDDTGSITTPSYSLPFSSFASPEAKQKFVERFRAPSSALLGGGGLAAMREALNGYKLALLTHLTALYPYRSTKSMIGRVPVETFEPMAGIAPENKDRVLINLHGGAFISGGGGPGGAVESIPVAGVGRIKVVAVDYRLGPENKFPTASEDVATVYRELLKGHRSENIGIYGSSAGGLLTGESIAWFRKENLPLPGAIGIFCAGAYWFTDGDSAQIWPRMGSVLASIPTAAPTKVLNNGYFENVSTSNPLAVPAASSEVMRAFPPTMFLTGTRSPEMSAAVQSHQDLLSLGVTSQLVLFDGMDHGFFLDPDLPESRRAYDLISRFFLEYLGRDNAHGP